MNFVLLILNFAVACAFLFDKDDNCTCKIVTKERRTYCGYELKDPNCYPHALYKCPNGDNGKADQGQLCDSTICSLERDAAACKAHGDFYKGIITNILKYKKYSY
jgi:hypothetical protein